MARRPMRPVMCLLGALLLGVSAVAGTTFAAAPELVSAVSRMSHGARGTQNVSLSGASSVEGRSIKGGVSVVLRFNQRVTGGSVAVTGGMAKVKGAPVFAGERMTVQLTDVGDSQVVTLTLSNISSRGREKLSSKEISFRIVQGDVNGDGKRTDDDVLACQKFAAAGRAVNRGNFRGDVDHNGVIDASDATLVQDLLRVAPPPPDVQLNEGNTPPTISTIPDQTGVSGQPTTPVGFSIGDAETTDPSQLTVTAVSDNQTVVPNANIALAGTGAARTITITPASGIASVTPVQITVTVSDGTDQAQAPFTLTVVPPPTIYLATLAPIAGVQSLGYGSATLTVSGTKTSAVLRFTYSNLSSALTDDAIYAPPEAVLYDIPVGKAQGHQQPDGSYIWPFAVADRPLINSTIEANTAYIKVQTALFPAGELVGTFKKVTGSQTFTPPPDPPAITINPPNKYDASRFLQQAGFGGTASEIAALSNVSAPNAGTAIEDWLDAQFAMPGPIYPSYAASAIAPVEPLGPQSASQPYSSSSMYYHVYTRICNPQAPNPYGDSYDNNRIHEAWWRNAVSAPDQLRQRVATAYGEILVVSLNDGNLENNQAGVWTYYDMLANDAFVNYRQILSDVTLHPIMGIYLNMKGNKKAVPPAMPNENYAREILQLFSIGLYQLQPDGTLKLDANGQPIPTYGQEEINNFAQVFTGWDQDTARVIIPTLPQPATGQPVVVSNVNSYYQKPMTIRPNDHSTFQKNLLTYPGAPTYPGASQPAMIPARTPQTAATATAELNFALDNIFYHPNVGPFVCKQMIMRLVGSNPSPAYVYRVAKVFDDDGSPQHVRGNMQAVIKAILTDYEARSPILVNDPGYGHAREPMIRVAQLIRSCGGFSKSGKFTVGKTDTTLNQTILRSPTVFNYFDPRYTEPGPIQQAGIVSPELEIIYSTTITNAQNMIYTGIYSHNYNKQSPTGTGFRGDSQGSDVYLNFNADGCGLVPLAQSSGTAAMVDQAAVLIMGAPLESKMKATILNFIGTKISPTNYLEQVKAAVHLVATSPHAATQK